MDGEIRIQSSSLRKKSHTVYGYTWNLRIFNNMVAYQTHITCNVKIIYKMSS